MNIITKISKYIKERSERTFLVKQIQEVYNEQGHSYIPEPNQYRCSSIAYCSRRIQWDKIRKKDAKPFDKATLGNFAIGQALHEYIQNILPVKTLLGVETKVSKKIENIEIVGHVDLILLHPEYGLYACDIKSCNERAFNYKLKSQESSDHHRYQSNTLSYILGLDLFSVLYVEKNSFSMLEFIEETSEVKFLNVVNKLITIQNHIDGNTLADCDAFGTWECNYCPYKHLKECIK